MKKRTSLLTITVRARDRRGKAAVEQAGTSASIGYFFIGDGHE